MQKQKAIACEPTVEMSIDRDASVLAQTDGALEEALILPFSHSFINRQALGGLSNFSGIWTDKLNIDQTRIVSPFDYDKHNLENLRGQFDFASKNVFSANKPAFFSSSSGKHLLLRTTLCEVHIGSPEDSRFLKPYKFYLTDQPTRIKVRLSLLEPVEHLAIATVIYYNEGPTSVRVFDKARGIEETLQLIIDSLQTFRTIFPGLPQLANNTKHIEPAVI